MRIAIIAGAFAPNRFGSPAVLAEQTAIGLRDRGHQVYVIAAAAEQEGQHSMSRWEVSAIPVLGIAVPATGPLGSVEDRVAQVLGVLRPDVVHAHSPRFLGPGPVRAAQRLGIPTVITMYGNQADWPAPVLAGAAGVLVGGPRQQHGLAGAGVNPAVIHVCPNGAATPAAGWLRTPHRGPLRIGYLGGMSDELGYQVVLSALTQLRRTDYELHVVDAATARGVRSIREWDFRVPGLLRLHARFPPPVRDRFFGAIDVLLALPQNPGSACLSVREALLRDVWPIASDIEGAAQVVASGRNGVLVPPTAADRVASAIGWALDNRAALSAARDAGTMGAGIATIDDQVAALEGVYAALAR